MRKLSIFLCGILICCVFVCARSEAAVRFPSPKGFVNDYAGVLSQDAEGQIGSLLALIEKKTSVEVAVVTVKTTVPLTIGQYAVELFQDWGIGKKGPDNGVLLLVATDDRKIRIEVGYGLEGAITDMHSKMIIDDLMIPHFKKGDFDLGIMAGAVMIAKIIRDEYNVDLDLAEAGSLPVSPKGARKRSPLSVLLTFVFFVLIFGFRFGTLFFLMSGRGGYWSGGSGGSFGGGFGGFGGGMSGGGGASGSW
ncbi:MAG: TPM domain-containing protein [Candidatus Omnitrophica bacterium]|nr:TPM domain-containing protein [Candidatus Omnitrophota bacterium]